MRTRFLIPVLVPVLALATTAVPAAADEPRCSGKVTIGNPSYRGGGGLKPGGQHVTTDVPVQIRSMAVLDGDLHAHTLYELWMVPGAAKPEMIRRYAGDAGSSSKLVTGACADARFPQLSGVAAGPGGSIIATDRVANAVVRVDAPGKDSCMVTQLAAKGLRGPTHPAIIADDIYVVDDHNKVKRIKDGEATLVAALPSKGHGNDAFSGMVALGGKLYLTFLESMRNSIVELDPATGTSRVVLTGDGSAYPPLSRNVVPGLAHLTTDGARLYTTGRAYLWTITPDGKIEQLAGSGADEWRGKDDPFAPRSGNKLILPGSATSVNLAYLPGHGLLFRGRAGYYNNSYVLLLTCR
jgi:hypothetical protein